MDVGQKASAPVNRRSTFPKSAAPAEIQVDGKTIGIGGIELDLRKGKGKFWPSHMRQLETPLAVAQLKVPAKNMVYSICNLRQSTVSAARWEFEIG
jgi:hypothetical protein